MSIPKNYSKKYSFDLAEIYCKAGNGGDGVIAFRREKFVPYGGPSGGDGGKGGDIILKVNKHLNTLTKFKYKNIFKAEDGYNGEGDNKKGKDGENLIIEVPPGTLVWDLETGELLKDLTEDGEEFILCRGGKGGKGNASFATPTERAPRIRELGEKGEEKRVLLELKIIADGALVGYPNVGKSTILSKISNAKPKIAPYPFTTLTPVIGEVRVDDKKSYTVVDLPGIIDGASEGKGLGLEFLRHIERTYFLIFVLDASLLALNPINQFENLTNEINNYNKEILNKEHFIVLNKIDLLTHNLDEVEEYFKGKNIDVIKISAINNIGIDKLINRIGEVEIKKVFEKIEIEKRYTLKEEKKKFELKIRKEAGKFIVECEELERILKGIDLDSNYGVRKLQDISKKFSLEEELKKHGIKNGDKVIIGGIEFRYYE
ncbi:MAG: GTPase ObgE [Caldisericia bacterium]|nr:GTPase ObgE [Caldisericia bacterium]